MSLDGLRDAYSREKKNEIANCELSRKRKLRELYNYTALLNAGHPPQLQDWSWATSDDISSEDERRFLDQNDITK
jgi:chromatin modification-related protein VID21